MLPLNQNLDRSAVALLKRGLDPNAANAQGRKTLNTAEQHGKDSTVYRVLKGAEEK